MVIRCCGHRFSRTNQLTTFYFHFSNTNARYSVALEEVCPLQPTFAGCVVKLGSALDWGRRFYLRRPQASHHKKKKGKKNKTIARESDRTSGHTAADPAAATQPAEQTNPKAEPSSVVTTSAPAGPAVERRALPCCCGVSPTSTELIACSAWSEAATEEFVAGLPPRLAAALAANDVVACCCGPFVWCLLVGRSSVCLPCVVCKQQALANNVDTHCFTQVWTTPPIARLHAQSRSVWLPHK